MPTIIPFRALTYSTKYQNELEKVIAPPYDVISPDGLAALRNRHSYNAVKLSLVDDPNDPDRYLKMKERFNDWKSKGVFEQSPGPAFYLIEEDFKVGGEQKTRVGFVALMEVSPFAEKKVLPHEFTLAGPKKDRLELLTQMGAELSQVFLCYKDSGLVLEKIHSELKNTKPFLSSPEVDHVARNVWKISEPAQCQELIGLLSKQSVLIADGHHRYETSVHFREIDGTGKSKYVQVYFTNLESPGFAIQPIHRLFSLPKEITAEAFIEKMRKNFSVEEVKNIAPDLLGQKTRRGEASFFIKLAESSKTFLVSRKKISDEDAEIFIIQKNIFEEILNWDVATVPYGVLKYEHELGEFEKSLSKLPQGVGIFLPPTNLDLVMKRALRGERMPQKSTYFYPKIASGLINYELGNI